MNDPQSNISDGGYLRKFLTIFRKKISIIHCVISARIQSYSGPHFPAFGLNTVSPYSVRMRENADQNYSEYGHFLCSDNCLAGF